MRSLAALAALTVLLATGCSPGEDEPTAQPTPATEAATPAPADADPADADQDQAEPQDDGAAPEGEVTTVDIEDFEFQPEDVTVAVGDTVEWVQLDDSRHTVDFDDGEESGTLEEGETYERTFDEAGTYSYVCFFHPRMTATVEVQG